VKILQVIARVNRGGTARWLNELTLGLRASGHEVLLAAGHVQEGETEDQIFDELGGHRIESLGRSISIFADVKALVEVRKYIVECKPDLINTHTAKAGLIGRLAAASIFKDRPAIVHTYHGHLLYGYFSEWKSKLFIIIEKFLVTLSDVLISAGDKVKNELIDAGIGKEVQYFVARPGIKVGDLESKKTIRARMGFPDESVIVGWLGRLAPIKRPDRVVQLAKELNNLTFVIGGDGELLTSLEKDLPSNVKLLGWISPEEIWALSDIALLTSDNEAQPISLIEASLAGLPIVAENVGSVSEVVDEEVTGFLVHSHLERIQALRKLSESSELRTKIGSAGKRYCEEKFSPQQFVNSHLKAYEIALERRNSKN
jgi:glycosyltransferase involved in cell wall biosynthesis